MQRVSQSHTRRRKVLATTIALGVAAGGILAWRILHPGVHPEKFGVRLVHFKVHSRLVGKGFTQLGVVLPPLSRGHRPLLVFLHGRSSSPDEAVSDAMLEALGHAGNQAPDVVLANGDDASYYHDRRTGRWGTYIVQEVIPKAVHVLHADPDRVAVGGVSMGGFGALDLARLWPQRFCAVGGHSAALWRTGGETPEGAFDDAEDFGRHDLFTSAQEHPPLYGDIPIWMDVGDEDPFHDSDTAFAHLLQQTGNDITFHNTWHGGHKGSYWQSHMRQYVGFYADALAAC